jgi:hypothetical protein
MKTIIVSWCACFTIQEHVTEAYGLVFFPAEASDQTILVSRWQMRLAIDTLV